MRRMLLLALTLALIGLSRGRSQETDPLPGVIKKIPSGTCTPAEVVTWLKGCEAAPENASYSWAHLISQIHHQQYPADEYVTFFLGMKLFIMQGPENNGWERVKLAGGLAPKFITDDAGKKVDMAHAFAGVCALCNRGETFALGAVNTEIWGRSNTGWGDTLQNWSGDIKGTWAFAKGIFLNQTVGGGYKQFEEGYKDWKDEWKPDDQVRGNYIGMSGLYYLRSHRGAKLSEAIAAAFEKYQKKYYRR